MNLSEHFTEQELAVVGAEQRIKDNAEQLCESVLEPIRAKFGPLEVTSGERCAAHNAAVGGEPTSFHLFNEGRAAVDIRPLQAAVTQVFKWICLESGLPFDKAIMEYEGDTPDIIHLQIDCANPPRREGFVGMTHGMFSGRKYTAVNVNTPAEIAKALAVP